MSFWKCIKKTAAVLALVLLLNTAFTALTVSALPAQSNLQKVQEELNLSESEIQELLLFMQENSSSIEDAVQADPDLKSKVEQFNKYSKEVSLILAFAEIARSNTSMMSHSTDSSLQSEISPAVWPNGINQGESIIRLFGNDGKEYLRLDVFTSQSRNHTRWHYHTKDDWKDHKGNIDLYHNSLPKWGSE